MVGPQGLPGPPGPVGAPGDAGRRGEPVSVFCFFCFFFSVHVQGVLTDVPRAHEDILEADLIETLNSN